MRIWAISDTHGKHDQLIVPDDIDMIICAGDASNSRNSGINNNEMLDFYAWFESLKPQHKIFVAGNHDVSIERGLFKPTEVHLLHESITINGINIFGSPYTPSFGNGWAFNKDRSKLSQYWENIPLNTDIVITHGPPKGVLDLSYSVSGNLEMCGCAALRNRIKQVKPKYSIFGHIHNCEDIINQGTRTINGTTYVNASCVTDGKFNQGPSSNGVIINL